MIKKNKMLICPVGQPAFIQSTVQSKGRGSPSPAAPARAVGRELPEAGLEVPRASRTVTKKPC